MDLSRAQVVIAKCRNGKPYGIRMEKNGKSWSMTWAFPTDEGRSGREGYSSTAMQGNFTPAAGYNGCPYCGAKYFLLCGCGKISCYNNEETVSCNWCGTQGKAQKTDNLSVNGSTF